VKLRNVLTTITLSAVLVSGAGVAVAAPATPAASLAASVKAAETARFTDRDVITFFSFGLGPISESVPELAAFIPAVQEEIPAEVIDEVVDYYLAAEPDFNTAITLPLQSGDPRQAQAAIAGFQDATEQVATDAGISTDVADAGDASAQCIVWLAAALAVAGAIAGTVVLVVNVNAVFNITYSVNMTTSRTAGSELSSQQFAAELARVLQS